jgi:DNA-binding transcriptional LysR family regulator
MELRHLRYFAAVAELAHMGRAAERLRVAQSALSRQLQDLEREVGAVLFERHPRGVRLTAAGEAFLAHARAALASAEAGAASARAAAAGQAGRLRVAPPDFGGRAVAAFGALARFRERLPVVAVELAALPWTSHAEALLADRIDVGFAIGASVDDYPAAIGAAAIGPEPLAWALLPAAHPLASRGAVALGELVSALPMVLSERAAIPALHDRITAALARAGQVPRVVSSPPAWAAVAQLVAAGAGWCVVAAGAEQPPPGTAAVRVPELAAEVALELHVLWRRDAAGSAGALAAAFVECVLEQAAGGEPGEPGGAGPPGASAPGYAPH